MWWDALEPVPIFEIIQHAGNISEEEMRKTFNLGIGMVFVTDKNRRDILCERLRSRGEDPLLIGDVVATSI